MTGANIDSSKYLLYSIDVDDVFDGGLARFWILISG